MSQAKGIYAAVDKRRSAQLVVLYHSRWQCKNGKQQQQQAASNNNNSDEEIDKWNT